jgi:S1-C subfamily serine protease
MSLSSVKLYRISLIVGVLVVSAVVLWRILDAIGDRDVAIPGDEQATIRLFKEAAPSVVNITSVSVQRNAYTLRISEIPQGSGSGFVWDNEGHIVTNFHVIQNAATALVRFADKETYRATVVGTAPHKDLAVLKIDAPKEKLTPIPLGRSSDLQVGQSVFVIGNPFGLDHTLTTGVISGLDREIDSVTNRPIQGVIQTDAAINPGNSGGPLLDSSGRLIGVNTQLLSPSGVYAGVGFAVPVDTVNRITPQLIQYGKPLRSGLGIKLLSDKVGQMYNIPGVLFWSVVPKGAAARAGLRPSREGRDGRFIAGDAIIGMEGEPVGNQKDLFRLLDNHRTGETVELEILRKQATHRVSVTLQALP